MNILIFDKSFSIQDSGGPQGYLYNIHEYLKDCPNESITFYSDLFCNNDNNRKSNQKTVDACIEKRNTIREKIHVLHNLLWMYYKQLSFSQEEIEKLNGFDFIHVHAYFDVLHYHKAFSKLRAKIIYTCHTPEPALFEWLNTNNANYLIKTIPFLKSILLHREAQALYFADYLMFPVKQSIEVYTESCYWYKRMLQKKNNKIFYVPTAIVDSGSLSIENYRQKQNTKQINICFIGRHNEIKGYDVLKVIAKHIWLKNKDIHFYIGGIEGPLCSLHDERWHELGWVKTSDILPSMDLLLLPNKQTYFDIIMLEALRAGVPVIASRTGGNKWFENKAECVMLYDYDDVQGAISYIHRIIDAQTNGTYMSICKEAREIYCNYFTFGQYISSYIKQVSTLQ